MRSAFVSVLAGGVLLGTTACGWIMGPDEFRSAWVDLDPAIVRTVHYFGGTDERTTAEIPDIGCLHTDPGTCMVWETMRVEIHNEGSTVVTLHLDSCVSALQRRVGGMWQPNRRSHVCIAVAILPTEIPSGETLGMDVSVYGVGQGEYRIGLRLTDEYGELPETMRTSVPFQLPWRETDLLASPRSKQYVSGLWGPRRTEGRVSRVSGSPQVIDRTSTDR